MELRDCYLKRCRRIKKLGLRKSPAEVKPIPLWWLSFQLIRSFAGYLKATEISANESYGNVSAWLRPREILLDMSGAFGIRPKLNVLEF